MHSNTVIFCFVLALQLQGGGQGNQAPSVQETLNLLQGSLQAITSFDVTVNCSIKLLLKMEYTEELFQGKKRPIIKSSRKLQADEQAEIIKKAYRQVYQNGKGRVEIFEGDGSTVGTIFVYDREIQESYRPREKDALIRGRATCLIEQGWDYREAFETVLGDFSILTCFRERNKKATTRFASTASSVIVLESPPDPKANNTISYQKWGFRIFLDRDRGFVPAVIETFELVREEAFTVRRTTVQEWKDLGGGIWVPIKAKTQVYLPDAGLSTFGEVYSEAQMVVDLPRSSWNKAISDNTFLIALPTGTKVIDQSRQVQFITGKPDPGDNLDDLVANARNIVPYGVQKPPRIEPQSPWIWMVVGGICALLCALALWLSVRFIRKHRYAK